MKSVHPSLRKGRKSVFMVSLAQSKKTSDYHNALRSMPCSMPHLPVSDWREGKDLLRCKHNPMVR